MRHLKPGLTLAEHRQSAAELRTVTATIKTLRRTIKECLGSADSTYGTATRVVNAVQALQTALMFEAAGAHAGEVSMATLKALYEGEGEA